MFCVGAHLHVIANRVGDARSYHPIVAHEVTNSVTDRNQLAAVARDAREESANPQPTVLADRAYFDGYQIRERERAGIATMVSKPLTSNS